MSRGKFSGQTLRCTVAALALIAGLGGPALAQTAPQTPAATSELTLPEPLAALNLNRISIETKRDGLREVEGRTADGVEIDAKVDMAGNVLEVEAGDGPMPQSLIDALLPAAARGHEAMALLASVEEIKLRPDHIEVNGNQPDGEDAELKFALDGTLVGAEVDDAVLPDAVIQSLLPQAVRDAEVLKQFATIDEIGSRHGNYIVRGEDQSGRDMGAAFDQEGRVLRFGSDDGPKRDRGGRGHDHDGDRRGGPREGHHGDHAGHNERRGEGRPAPAFDAVAVNQRLAGAGYSAFGFIRPDGPRALLEATNPQGERVLLELDPAGEVVRETAR